ncbi:MAG: NmrA family NAD(P)-binding protein [Phenylobacterium sp.]|uniref:NmrA family NAD(P)-binding protein n=1 Tax=Phenylobacterium sp. TaxID=1871053 RepID=UPI0025FEA71B|nr:NmrA family NAD(P)-binding protein [Phenylobacterium sp.]MCA6233241.1 NmrA family NAD(P)-binding protein [Phenylobacterium sp.]MCA6234017.1 NmrA family NAD(P)-binding protein [Phenylobacterium sp.]MCA6249583.1 NmrA family NAD(P)-binding protein [Phenylobacterium sp.]MCA6257880.1 NmrA family NAD(P)-binding protein [Phenylobacterium sp.]MCA6262890.1 NmrA family NAD(P)-binding protein [Phenylobacterium sp.]
MTNRILVTGAAGNIGAEIVKRLQARKADFAVMTHASGGAPAGAGETQGDFLDPASLRRAFEGVDTLFLLFPLVPEMPRMAANAVAAAKAAGVRHIVRSSGAGADAASPAAIAKVHGEIDALIRNSGIPFTLLLPTSFMQNLVNFYGAAIRDGALYAPRGDGATAVIDVRDIADVAVEVLTDPAAHAGQSYTLTGPEDLTDAQMVSAIARQIGRDVRYVDVPEAAAVDSLTRMGSPPQVIEWLMSLNHVIKQGWAAGVSPVVETITGRPPRNLADFVRENAAAWK